MDQEEALKEQKEQCIFCKIVKGDVPAKKVYEDDQVLAILDIHPAAKGHVLVLPKEHYPILPLVPLEEMLHLFKRTYDIKESLQEAMLCSKVTLLIANGAAAGQQSPHFLFHLIPREEGDLLPLNIPEQGDKEGNDALGESIKQRFSGLMKAFLSQTGRERFIYQEEAKAPPEQGPIADQPKGQAPQTTEERLDKLIKVINENDDLKEALLERPEEVKEAVEKFDNWRELFAGVDIDKLSENLRVMAASQAKQRATGADLDEVSKVL